MKQTKISISDELQRIRALVESAPANGQIRIVALKASILDDVDALERKLSAKAKKPADDQPAFFAGLERAIKGYKGGI